MKIGDIVSGAALAGLGIFIILSARAWDYLGIEGPGPGFFPLWYGMLMVALSLVLIVTSVVKRSAAGSGKAVTWHGVGRALSAWLALAVCVGLLKVLGFAIAFGLFTFFLVYVMYRRPLLSALAVAVGVCAGFYLIFPLALNVGLPVGKLGF